MINREDSTDELGNHLLPHKHLSNISEPGASINLAKAEESLAIVERQTSLTSPEALSAIRIKQNRTKQNKTKEGKMPAAVLTEAKEDV